MNSKVFDFLEELKKHNQREWFNDHKLEFEEVKMLMTNFFQELHLQLSEVDEFDEPKIYRIYRDVRFSKDKTPYKTNFSAIFKRKQPYNRGSFYVQIESGNSFVGGGFWGPEKDDLLRIRQAIDYEDSLENIIKEIERKSKFDFYKGEALKTIPKGFDREHPRAELLRQKQFLLIKNYNDKEVLAKDFQSNIVQSYLEIKSFYEYMSDVLTTNGNGELIV